MSCALIFTAVCTPFEVAFISAAGGRAALADSWFWMNRGLEGIFSCDLVLQFFVAVKQGREAAEAVYIEDQRVIAKRYLRGWFPTDFCTIVVPLSLDLAALANDGSVGLAASLPPPWCPPQRQRTGRRRSRGRSTT